MKDAKLFLRCNQPDIFAGGDFTYAVIEEVPSGPAETDRREWWYKAVYPKPPRKRGGYRPTVKRIKQPNFLSHMCWFGVG